MKTKLIKKLKEFNAFLPLDKIMQKSIKDFLDVKYNYNSNAIEGTTLSEKETSLVLKGQTIPKHSLIEHFEVINHKNAFNFIFDLSSGFEKSKKKFSDIFTEDNILKIHSFLLNNINDDWAGIYRQQNVRIAFSRAVLPRYEKVSYLMNDFIVKYIDLYEKIDLNDIEKVLEFGYLLHLDFVKIHPFVDGNGRTARLLQNLWFLYTLNNVNIVYFKNRQEYIESIEKSDNDIKTYIDFMNSNFLEFKEEELELVINKEIYKY
ncbi:MAG: Fic family protein [Candidatus Gracilibacteria bacterium]|nr:Fic family protein [Candidatus Gracilibacteria bacterium]